MWWFFYFFFFIRRLLEIPQNIFRPRTPCIGDRVSGCSMHYQQQRPPDSYDDNNNYYYYYLYCYYRPGGCSLTRRKRTVAVKHTLCHRRGHHRIRLSRDGKKNKYDCGAFKLNPTRVPRTIGAREDEFEKSVGKSSRDGERIVMTQNSGEGGFGFWNLPWLPLFCFLIRNNLSPKTTSPNDRCRKSSFFFFWSKSTEFTYFIRQTWVIIILRMYCIPITVFEILFKCLLYF